MNPVTTETNEFVSFFNSLQAFLLAHQEKHFNSTFLIAPHELYALNGKRYIKVCLEGSGVYAFIDKTNGDIFKPASWSAPAKHARGNIFAEDNGMGCCGPYGVAYLR